MKLLYWGNLFTYYIKLWSMVTSFKFLNSNRQQPRILRRAGGFLCVVSERQAIEIPPGYLVAECALTAQNTIAHWVTMRPTDLEDAAISRLDRQVDIVFQLLRVDQKQEQPCEIKSSILEKTLLQLEVAPVLFKWLRGKIGPEPVEDTGLCKKSLDLLRGVYMGDKGFQNAVLSSAIVQLPDSV